MTQFEGGLLLVGVSPEHIFPNCPRFILDLKMRSLFLDRTLLVPTMATDGSCVYRKLRLARIGDAVRRGAPVT
jgi:hypothetical protein